MIIFFIMAMLNHFRFTKIKYYALTTRSVSYMPDHDCKNRKLYQMLLGSEKILLILRALEHREYFKSHTSLLNLSFLLL